MSRIFPQNYQQVNKDSYSKASYKKTWGYGQVSPKIGYVEFIDTIESIINENFFIWIQRYPFLSDEEDSFVDITVVNPANGIIHLIEYFPFNNEIITSKKINNSIECFRNFDLNKNNKPIKINDYPCERLEKFSSIITNHCYSPSSIDHKVFKNNHIKKHFFFGSLKKNEAKKYFTSSENISFYGYDDIDKIIKKIDNDNTVSVSNWSAEKLKKIEKLCLPSIKKADITVPITLDPMQQRHVNRSTKSKIMELKGGAGSGKTFVLIHRMQSLLAKKKKVLITYYTKDYKSYLKHQFDRPNPYEFQLLDDYGNPTFEITNIHRYMVGLCKVIRNAGFSSSRSFVPSNYSHIILDALEEDKEKFSKLIKNSLYIFDAVLVDEGQNFQDSWIEVLRKIALFDKDLNLMIGFDEKQVLYKQSLSFSNSLKERKSIEDPLDGAYRIPEKLFEKISRVNQYINQDYFNINVEPIGFHVPDQYELKFKSPGEFKWFNVYEAEKSIGERINDVTIDIINKIETKSMHLSDCAILVQDHVYAAKIQEILKQKNIDFIGITNDEEILEPNKLGEEMFTLIVLDSSTGYKKKSIITKPKIIKGTELAYDWSKNRLRTGRLTDKAQQANDNLKEIYRDDIHSGFKSNNLITHTIKSFQGQEIPNVFVFISQTLQDVEFFNNSWNKQHDLNQTFVAITRARKSLYIYNDNENLDSCEDVFNRE